MIKEKVDNVHHPVTTYTIEGKPVNLVFVNGPFMVYEIKNRESEIKSSKDRRPAPKAKMRRKYSDIISATIFEGRSTRQYIVDDIQSPGIKYSRYENSFFRNISY